jgi:hypothetical protein
MDMTGLSIALHSGPDSQDHFHISLLATLLSASVLRTRIYLQPVYHPRNTHVQYRTASRAATINE